MESATELTDDGRRRPRRRQGPGPLIGDGIGKALLHEGGYVRENGGAFLRRRRQRLELAGLNLRHDGRIVPEQAVELPAYEIAHRLRRSAIGHGLELHARGRLEEFEPEVGDGA